MMVMMIVTMKFENDKCEKENIDGRNISRISMVEAKKP